MLMFAFQSHVVVAVVVLQLLLPMLPDVFQGLQVLPSL